MLCADLLSIKWVYSSMEIQFEMKGRSIVKDYMLGKIPGGVFGFIANIPAWFIWGKFDTE